MHYSLFIVTPEQSKNGSGTVSLLDPDAGAISHITIFGVNNTSQVPEPTTLMLLGAGILGTVVFSRRRK